MACSRLHRLAFFICTFTYCLVAQIWAGEPWNEPPNYSKLNQLQKDRLKQREQEKKNVQVVIRDSYEDAGRLIGQMIYRDIEVFGGIHEETAKTFHYYFEKMIGNKEFELLDRFLSAEADVYEKLYGANDWRTMSVKNKLVPFQLVFKRGNQEIRDLYVDSYLQRRNAEYGETQKDYDDATAAIQGFAKSLEALGITSEFNPEVASAFFVRSKLQYRRSKLAESMADVREALNIMKRSLVDGKTKLCGYGTQHPMYAAGLILLGDVHRFMGHLPVATRLHREALDILNACYDRPHRDKADLLTGLAIDASFLKDFVESLEIHRQAVKMFEECDDAPLHRRSDEHSALAECYLGLGRFDEGLKTAQEATRLATQCIEDQSVFYGRAKYAEGMCYLRLEKPDDVIRCFNEAAIYYHRYGGNDDIVYGMACSALGLGHFRKGNLEQAELYLKGAVSLLLRKLGPGHRNLKDSAEIYDQLLTSRWEMQAQRGDFEAARKTAAECVELWQRLTGTDLERNEALLRQASIGMIEKLASEPRAAVIKSFGQLRDARRAYDAERFTDANRLAKSALDVQLKQIPEAKYYVSKARYFLGMSAWQLGNRTTAIEQLDASLTLMSELYGKSLCPEGAMATMFLAEALTEAGGVQLADSWFNIADVLVRRYQGPDTVEFARLQTRRARTLIIRGKLVDAEIMQREAREIFARRVEKSNALYRELLAELAWTVARLGQFDEAQNFYQQVVEAYGGARASNESSPLPLRVTVQQAALNSDQERTDAALQRFRAIVTSPEMESATIPDQIFALTELARRERRSGNLSESYNLANTADSLANENRLLTSETISLVAEINPEMLNRWIADDRLADAIKHQDSFVRSATARLGESDWRTVLFQRGLDALQAVNKLPTDKLQVMREAIAADQEAHVLAATFKFQEAGQKVETARRLWQNLDVSPLLYDATTRLQADLLRASGQYFAANDVWTGIIAARERTLDDHPWLASALIDAGFHSLDQVDLKVAEQRFQRAADIFARHAASPMVDSGRAQTGLALVHLQNGRYSETHLNLLAAESLLSSVQMTAADSFQQFLCAQAEYQIALDFRPQDSIAAASVFADKHCDADSLAMTRSAFLRGRDAIRHTSDERDQGAPGKSDKDLRNSAESFRNKLGANSLSYARALISLAANQANHNQNDEARTIASQAESIIHNSVGKDHPLEIELLRIRSRIAASRGESSIDSLKHALDIARRTQATTSLSYVELLVQYGDAEMAISNIVNARKAIEEGVKIATELVEGVGSTQTEEQQMQLIKRLRSVFKHYVAWNLNQRKPDELYDAVLRWKGVQLADNLRFIHEKRVATTAQDAQQWERLTNRLAGVATRIPLPEERGFWLRQVNYLANERDEIERRLRRASASRGSCPTTSELVEQLPADVVLLDYVRCETPPVAGQPVASEDRGACYAVFVLRHSAPVQVVILPDARSIDQDIELWRSRSEDIRRLLTAPGDDPDRQKRFSEISADFLKVSMQLRSSLWEKVEPLVGETHTVLLSPDGTLDAIPFAAIPGPEGAGYLISKYAFVTVFAPRLLPELLKKAVAPGGNDNVSISMFGGIDYDASPQQRFEATPDLPSPVEQDFTKMNIGSTAVRRDTFQFLAGAQNEVDELAKLIRQLKPNATVDKFTGDSANENEYRRQLVNHRWFHLATHGFFDNNLLPGNQSELANRSSTSGKTMITPQFAELPTVLSRFDFTTGLSFAGANQANDANEDDGILWGMEVKSKDLSSVELVVLSACDTAKGRSFEGEGPLSMQRAFLQAGTKTVVSTLWPIADGPASLLMQRFYRNVLRDGMSKNEAIREAQIWFLESGQRGLTDKSSPELTLDSKILRPYYSLPQLWAPFVLNGDWR